MANSHRFYQCTATSYIHIVLWTPRIIASHNQHSIALTLCGGGCGGGVDGSVYICVCVCVSVCVCVMPLGRPSFSNALHKAAGGTESS